jgi:gamma-glutamyltranspeptidase
MSHGERSRPVRLTAQAREGMVSTPHYLATGAGVETLARGGSAVDATIAASAVLCVVYPHMVGLGGDAFWLIADGAGGNPVALNASGRSAAAATAELYRNRGLQRIPARGPLAAITVPGAVDGWAQAHQRYGRLPWASLFEPAAQHAESGAPVARSLARWMGKDQEILLEHDAAGEIFLHEGRPFGEGESLRQPDLAASFREIASGGRDAFYRGSIAQETVRHLESLGGLLSLDDFAGHRSDWVDPILTTYRGYQVYTFPPNSQGVALLQILNILEGYDVTAMGDGTADYVHHVVEATKVAFADRDRWVSDPDFLEAPIAALLSTEYAGQLREQIDPNRALMLDQVPPGESPPGPSGPAQESVETRQGDTVYMAVVDRDGGCVSYIQSIYYDFGSAVVAGRTGILLQNRGSHFSLEPDHPNRLEPGKRTFHTLMPSMLLREGRPYLVFGSMGGEGQPQTQAAMVTRRVDFGQGVGEAIEAPRWLWGRAWGSEDRSLKLEARFPRETVEELLGMGHQVEVLGSWEEVMGHAAQILIDPASGDLQGAADPRSDGSAMGL